MIAYRAMLDVPRALAQYLSRLLQVERRARGTRRRSRALTCFRQAVFGLRWFREDRDVLALARDCGISRATGGGERITVADLAAAERLNAPPSVTFPAEFDLGRIVTPQALVSFRGNSYSVPPGLGGAQVQVRHRLGADVLRIVTAGGATVAVHRRAPDGAGRVIRDDGHVIALEHARACHVNCVSRRCTKIDWPAGGSEGTPSDTEHIVA